MESKAYVDLEDDDHVDHIIGRVLAGADIIVLCKDGLDSAQVKEIFWQRNWQVEPSPAMQQSLCGLSSDKGGRLRILVTMPVLAGHSDETVDRVYLSPKVARIHKEIECALEILPEGRGLGDTFSGDKS